VLNKKGMHARPAAMFVQMVEKLGVSVIIEKAGEQINGKSIMALLTLGAQCGTDLKIIVQGEDSEKVQKAMDTIEHFFSKQEEELSS
jgi:phosphocarrier protein HPr